MPNYGQSVGVELKDVDVIRGGTLVLKRVNLAVSPGEIVQLFGRNGSGKTSLLQVISGLTSIDKGNIIWHINEEPLDNFRPASLISFVGHIAPVKLALTGAENLAYWAKCYGAKLSDIQPLLERVNLDTIANIAAGRYSAGQKRRLDLGRCLIAKRPFWLLDEPTSSLDDESSGLWAQEITKHAARGGSAIIGTHDRLKVQSRDIYVN